MRALTLGPLLSALLLLGSCAQANRSPESPVAAIPGARYATNSHHAVVARHRLTIDPAGQVAVDPVRLAQRQGFSFDLDIAQFSNADSFKVRRVSRDANGDLVIHFSHAHPFQAPDFAQPTSGTNRADLGYTGRLLLLADSATESYFNSAITLDPALIASPDGYIQAGALLTDQSLTNDTFPFVLLADDYEDNRVGLSNGGSPMGNMSTSGNGWTRGNIGSGNDGWTGYDFVHQGQEVVNTFTVSATALSGGPISLDVAILIKYTDPRQGSNPAELRANRMPPATPDYTRFAYRLPQAALDASKITLDNTVHIPTMVDTCAQLDFRYRDWDSLGLEGSDEDLSDEANLFTVPPAAGNTPVAIVDAPFLGSSSTASMILNYGNGTPGSELQYTARLQNQLASATPGLYYACLQVTDPEDGNDSSYHYGVDPVTLAPTRPPLQASYQVVPISVETPPANTPGQPPSILSAPCEDGGQGGGPSIFNAPQITNGPTTIEWHFGGGATPDPAFGASPLVSLSSTPGVYTGEITASNAFGASEPVFFTFVVDNPNPETSPQLTMSVPSTPVICESGLVELTVTGFATTAPPLEVQFDWSLDGDYNDNGEALMAVTAVGQVFTSPVPLPCAASTLGPQRVHFQYQDSASAILTRSLSFELGGPPPTPGWVAPWGGAQDDHVEDIAIDANGGCVVAGYFSGNISNFMGQGPRTHAGQIDMIVYKLSPQGNHVWDQTFSCNQEDRALGVALDSGRVYVVAQFGGFGSPTCSFGPGTPGGYGGFLTFLTLDYGNGAVIDENYVFTADANPGDSLIPNDLTFRPPDQLVACGSYTDNAPAYAFCSGPEANVGVRDGFIVSVDADDLSCVWSVTPGSTGEDYVTGVTTDAVGNVYAMGNHAAAIDFGGGLRAYGGGVSDGFVVKYNQAGTYQWDRVYASTTTDAATAAVINRATSNLVVCGMYGNNCDLGNAVPRPASGVNDAFVASYTTANVYQWATTANGAGVQNAGDIGTDAYGNLVIVGAYNNTTDFGAGGIPVINCCLAGDCFYWRLDSGGSYLTATVFGGSQSEELYGVAVNLVGSSWIIGRHQTTADLRPGPLVSNHATAGLYDAFVMRVGTNGMW